MFAKTSVTLLVRQLEVDDKFTICFLFTNILYVNVKYYILSKLDLQKIPRKTNILEHCQFCEITYDSTRPAMLGFNPRIYGILAHDYTTTPCKFI